MSEWYTPEQLGARLQIEVRTLQAQARNGQIPGAKKIGARWRFDVSKIDAWLNDTLVEPTSRPDLTPSTQVKLERLRKLRQTRHG